MTSLFLPFSSLILPFYYTCHTFHNTLFLAFLPAYLTLLPSIPLPFMCYLKGIALSFLTLPYLKYLALICYVCYVYSLLERLSPMSSMARDQQPKPVKYTVHFLDNSESTFEVDVSCNKFLILKLRTSTNK